MRLRHYLKFILSLLLLSSNQIAQADISQTDLELTKQVLETIKQEKYDHAKYLIGEMHNKAAKQVGLHALYRSKGYVTHPSEIVDFIAKYPNWKNLTSIKSIMENRIFRGQYDRPSSNSWLSSYPAETAAGKLFMAEQLFLTGKTTQGLELLRSVWRGYVLDSKTEASVLAKMGQYFDRWDHKLRADFLMNANMTSAAIRNAGYASFAYIKLYEARTALESKQKNALEKYYQVAASLKKDMGLKYSLVKYYRRKPVALCFYYVFDQAANG